MSLNTTDMRHISGESNVIADALSRKPEPGTVALVQANALQLDLIHLVAEAQEAD